MDISIAMKHERLKHFRDELTEAIDKAERAFERRKAEAVEDQVVPMPITEVTVYAQGSGVGSGEVIIQINNDDMERTEVPDEAVYVEIDS